MEKDRIHNQAKKKSHSAHLWQLFRQTRNEYAYEIRKRKIDDNVHDITRVNTCLEPLVLSVTDVKKKKKKVLKDLNPTQAGRELAKSQKAVGNREKWRKLVVKSSVVPNDPRG